MRRLDQNSLKSLTRSAASHLMLNGAKFELEFSWINVGFLKKETQTSVFNFSDSLVGWHQAL